MANEFSCIAIPKVFWGFVFGSFTRKNLKKDIILGDTTYRLSDFTVALWICVSLLWARCICLGLFVAAWHG